VVAASGFRVKGLWVGSQGGLLAAARGECDVAGIHLLDPASGTYNQTFLPPGVRLQPGYGRMQGFVHRAGDDRFEGKTATEAVAVALADPGCLMVSRNRGSGTRVLIDGLLAGRKPPGSVVEPRSHHAVAAAVAQGRADWGVTIAPVAAAHGLGFLPIQAERYDFAIPESRWNRPAVARFREALADASTQAMLQGMGFLIDDTKRTQ
jgi:putative molybdopterin biosynthesis protein